ncbi:MAG: maleylpyruvate isomerase N-terminal domain-containing protein [Acidimicrobiales bacterium]|nr:maleylpyruvate isomerase N-terminal domain-containing protein [Acidimicrobiales bacterium]
MADPTFSQDEVTTAYRYVSHWWCSLVGAIDDDRWDGPALGEWSVRELVAHTNRVYRTILDYVAGDVKDPTPILSASDYFRIVLSEENPHVHIAERARREVEDYAGRDMVAVTHELARRAERLVGTAHPATKMHLFVGEMDLQQYLATRVVELVIHGLDLAAAIDLPTEPPSEASAVALSVLTALARPSDLSALLRLLTGRPASLPLTNVLG